MRITLLLLLIPALTFAGDYNRNDSVIDMNQFRNPGIEYRSAPFYSLNDLLDTVELRRQIIEFAKGGYGGVYLHSRVGLLTGYLDNNWWNAMDAGEKACREAGIYAWFYDEDKWPSGFAGGLVPLKNDDYHARCLMRLSKKKALPPTGTVIHEDSNYYYLSYKMKMGNAWFNGTCWVDLLNPETVSYFIETSYKPYAERYRIDCGKHILGIFTDEPQLWPKTDHLKYDGALPFSPVIIPLFKQQHGYDLPSVIPSLFDTVGNYRKIRLDFYRTIGWQMEHSFTKQIGEYCSANNMMLTGHFNGEEGLASVRFNTGNMMIQYRHMQQPGMDHLGLHIDNAINVARSLSSTANQYGIARRLSEAYGISGQNMSFEDRLWIASWHTLMGVNHLCPHLALYSMKGMRKRDYPPTLSPQQPYWPYNKSLEDYTARLCYLNTIAHYAPEFLVIHPLESEYIEGGIYPEYWTNRAYRFQHVLETIQKNHRDYDLGDEQILSEIGKINGQVVTVGRMNYRAVILPPMLTIRPSTINLLLDFAEQGGKIIAVDFPSFADGKENYELLKKLKAVTTITTTEKLGEAMSAALTPQVFVTGDSSQNVWIHRRMSGKFQVIQLTNISRKSEARVNVRLANPGGNMFMLNPADGKSYIVRKPANNGIDVFFAPAQTWFLADERLLNNIVPAGVYSPPQGSAVKATLTGNWQGKRHDANALTLDFASYSTDSGKTFSQPEPVLGIYERFTDKPYNGFLILRFTADISNIPSSCSLVMEQPQMYSAIMVNQKKISFTNPGFYRDNEFKSTNITPYLVKATNIIELQLTFTAPQPTSRDPYARYGSEIESIYLTGDFGVQPTLSDIPSEPSQRNSRGFLPEKPVHYFSSFTITGEKQVFTGNLATEGYPFYNGSFTLSREFNFNGKIAEKKYFLTFPLSEAIVITVKLNGKELSPIFWSPWETDITAALNEGKNTIEITLINSLRNLLGPHHNAEGELIHLSPGSFGGDNTWTTSRKGETDWYDVRINGKTNIWRDDYCIIPFGLLSHPLIVERNK